MQEVSQRPEAGNAGSPSHEDLSRTTRLHDRYSVVILGAGINGCGVFRDLCLQGVDCLLLDTRDFCSGASAAPSRLIHGGLKYLETGEFRLVEQSARERNLLLRNAPHYVKPVETLLPITSWFGGIYPSIRRFLGAKSRMDDRGLLIIELGLLLYDFFGRKFRTMPRHRTWLRKRLRAMMPDMDKRLLGASLYYEARVSHAERLGLELVLDALASCSQSTALNYASAVSASGNRLTLQDDITGKQFEVDADLVVNAGGCWIDRINALLGISSKHVGGTKGSHLVVANKQLRLALNGRMIYFGSPDGRVNLLYPFLGNVLVGATDIPVSDPDTATCTAEEAAYLLDAVRGIFPDIIVKESDIVFRYCGVRPLPRSEGIDPALVSRDHSITIDAIPDGGPAVFSLIGGKWTTFRGFSEEASDRILEQLSRRRSKSTLNLPIGGGRDYPRGSQERHKFLSDLAEVGCISQGRATMLFERYGTAALSVATWCQAGPDRPLASLPDYTERELERSCRLEHVFHLSDLLLRRTDIALSGRLNAEVVEEVGQLVGRLRGWTEEERRREIKGLPQLAVAVA